MMARTMRALALAATVGAVAAMAVAAPAYARVVDEEATLSTSGGVSVAWHGSTEPIGQPPQALSATTSPVCQVAAVFPGASAPSCGGQSHHLGLP